MNCSVVFLFADTSNTFCQAVSITIILIKISSANTIAHEFHHVNVHYSVSCGSSLYFRVQKHVLIQKFCMAYFSNYFLF